MEFYGWNIGVGKIGVWGCFLGEFRGWDTSVEKLWGIKEIGKRKRSLWRKKMKIKTFGKIIRKQDFYKEIDYFVKEVRFFYKEIGFL